MYYIGGCSMVYSGTVKMNNRGQAAIEFIFIILIVVVYLFSVTKPLIESTQSTITDIQNITLANNETQKIVNSVNKISLLGNSSKETLQLFIPENSFVGCYNDGTIGFITKINVLTKNPEMNLCKNNSCDKNISINDGIIVNCNFPLVSGQRTVIVEKQSDEINISEKS